MRDGVFEFEPLVLPGKVVHSDYETIYYGPTFVSERIGKTDVAKTKNGDLEVYSCPSRDAFAADKVISEDAAAVVDLGDKKVLAVICDGVSKSFLAEMAARTVSKIAAEKGTDDLIGNLAEVERELKNLHSSLDPADLSPMVADALRKKLDESGSETTANQFLIDRNSGLVKMLLAGDGGWAVLTRDGQVRAEFLNEGSSPPAGLSTKFGLVGALREESVRLDLGDTFLAFSDGVDEEMVRSFGEKSTEEIVAVVEGGLKRKLDDDKTLLIYRHH